jgi:nifR3 family TIM-barrel protein
MSVLRYGGIHVDPPLVLAPMAGITDRQFRLVLRRIGGVGLVTMEFISSEALVRKNKRARLLMRYAEEERPISIQIYGRDPAHMAEAARVVEEIGADICDINMGCPANKILKGCSGCALMGDLDLARAIVSAVRRAVSIPLSVKFRLGLDDERRNYLELGRICEGEGVDLVAMHARTARQMFGGQADWSEIARLKEALSIPVVGNGDVVVAEDVLSLLRQTGCDGVMIGRASMKNPWIYRQAADLLAGRLKYEPTVGDRYDVIRVHFEMVTTQEDPVFAMHKLRTFTGWYTHGLADGKRLRTRISEPTTPQEFLDVVETYFAEATKAAA